VDTGPSYSSKVVTKWAFGIFVLVLGLLGIHRLSLKANLPFTYQFLDGKLIATQESAEGIHLGDEIITIDDRYVSSEFPLEFLLDGKSIGDTITVAVRSHGSAKHVPLSLVPAYPDSLYYVTSLILGIALWGTALFITLKKPGEKASSMGFWCLMLFALSIMTPPGSYAAGPRLIVYLISAAFGLSYAFGAAAFLHFVALFPASKWERPGLFLAIVYLLAGVIGGMSAATDILAIATDSLAMASLNEDWHTGLRVFLAVGLVGGLGILLHSYLTSKSEPEKRKIEWILWGSAVGVTPFLVLHIVPSLFLERGLVREEFAQAFFILVPISIAIAIVKYHAFDIQVIIGRSIVYGLLTGVVVGFYFLVVAGASLLLRRIVGEAETFFSIIAACGVALLFNPARHRIQNLVDRTFYRIHYDFREALRAFTAEIKECVTLNQLGELIIKKIDELIPVERIALIILTEPGHRMRILAHRGFDLAAKHIPALHVDQITTDLKLPVANPLKVEPDVVLDTGMTPVLERWGISVAIPLSLPPKQIVGVIVLGDKRSGKRYTSSDLDLLSAAASQIALAVERLQLQEQLIVGEMEKRRLEELNQLKSEFVSSVSHELRTPLTSIRMFAETLLSRNLRSQKKRNEYLKIIQGESERLTRLINNILDFAKIERGVKQYTFAPTDVKAVLDDVMKSMEYQFEKLKFQVNVRLPRKVPEILADRDAVEEAVINLLSNAMKYSGKKRRIDVRLKVDADHVGIDVKDYGLGIPENEQSSIFDSFYRVREGEAKHVGGTGLGLALVKHIMDSHGGEVRVQSKLGKGSTFTLLFPIQRSAE